MNNSAEDMFELAKALWKNYFARCVDEKMAGCMRTRRGQVATAANGTTMGIQFPYEETVLNLPYVSIMADAAVGDQVTVAYIYGSATNGVVIQNGSFTK